MFQSVILLNKNSLVCILYFGIIAIIELKTTYKYYLEFKTDEKLF